MSLSGPKNQGDHPQSSESWISSESVPKHESETGEQEILIAGLRRLLTDSTLSDVVAEVGGEEFHLHKAILGTRSPVFAAMFAHDFEEAKTGRFKVPDITVTAFKVALDFIYAGKFPIFSTHTLELHRFADMYQLDSLKADCEEKLMKSDLTLNSVINVYIYADMHKLTPLKQKCFDYIFRNQTLVKSHESWNLLKNRPGLLLEMFEKLLYTIDNCDCYHSPLCALGWYRKDDSFGLESSSSEDDD